MLFLINKCFKDKEGVNMDISQLIESKKNILTDNYEKMSLYENEALNKGFTVVVGVDEAGRGPCAGPITAAAVVLSADHKILALNDSKKLNEKIRAYLYQEIINKAKAYSISFVRASEINEIGIAKANELVMLRALTSLAAQISPEVILVDYFKLGDIENKIKLPNFQYKLEITKGDSKSVSIAAASILAKYARDMYMLEQAKLYPLYKFEKNKGYGTQEHKEAIRSYGLCPEHRLQFVNTLLSDK